MDVIVLKQLLNCIPRGVLNQAAQKTGVEAKARTFSVFSRLATMLFAQLSHAISLNDVCDWLRLRAVALSRLHISPPSRNALSHANKVRSAAFIESLLWSVLEHLQNIRPAFAKGKKGKGLLLRFKVRIHAVDSIVMELVANCIGWAKHLRRKAAAKMHLDAEAEIFFGAQPERITVAGVYGPAGIRAAALPSIFVRLGTQFYASFCGGALRRLGTIGPAQTFEKLWDSIRANTICGGTQPSLAASLVL